MGLAPRPACVMPVVARYGLGLERPRLVLRPDGQAEVLPVRVRLLN